MNFARTDEQLMLADMADRLLAEANDFEARRQRLGTANPDRMALWPTLVEQGLLGALIPEEAGGFGGGARDLAVVMAAAGRHLVVEPLLAVAVAARLLHLAGHDVETIVAGGRVVVLAHDEGVDPFAPRGTLGECDADGWRISGEKPAVRHGDLAHAFIVSATVDGEDALFLVDAVANGVRREPMRSMDGASTATVYLDRCRAQRLDLDPRYLGEAISRVSLGLAAETVAIAAAMLERTCAYLIVRKQFGVPLATFQALQHRVADMKAALEGATALVERAIGFVDRGLHLGAAYAAKALADDSGRLVAHEAVQMHGGMGVSDELDISHYLRRLAVIRASHGGAAAHRAQVGDLAGIVDPNDPLDSFRKEVAAFVAGHLPPDIMDKAARGLEFGKDDFVAWQKVLRAHGWFAGAWPVEHGGRGWDLERQLAFVQEVGRAGAPMIIPYGVNMVGPVIYTFGNEEQKSRHLPGILSSDIWWCQGYSEPNAGSDLASLKTLAVRDGDHYVVNGTKMWTTEAHWADWMHCLVRTDRDARPQAGISFLLIDMTSPGIEVRPIVTIDGQHHTNQVFFDDVRVPVANLVGLEGQGWEIAKFLLANERVAIADTGPKLKLLADIKAMFATRVERDGQSRTMAVIQDRLADAEVQLASLCALEAAYVRDWAEGADRNGPQASILKLRGTEILQLLSEIALEIEGPVGAVHDPAALRGLKTDSEWPSSIAHHYLYGRCWSIFGGTSEIQRTIIARSLLA